MHPDDQHGHTASGPSDRASKSMVTESAARHNIRDSHRGARDGLNSDQFSQPYPAALATCKIPVVENRVGPISKPLRQYICARISFWCSSNCTLSNKNSRALVGLRPIQEKEACQLTGSKYQYFELFVCHNWHLLPKLSIAQLEERYLSSIHDIVDWQLCIVL